MVQHCSWKGAAPGTASVPKQPPSSVEDRPHPHTPQPCSACGVQPSNEVALPAGGVPLCRVGAGCAVMSAASLRVLRSHFRMLFLSQPPVEGGLGSANVSPQGGDRFRGSPGVSRPPQGVQSPGKRREGSRGRWEQGEGNPGRGQVGPCLRWRKMFRVQSSMRPAAIPGAGVPLRSGS